MGQLEESIHRETNEAVLVRAALLHVQFETSVAQLLSTTKPTATTAVTALINAGVLLETTGRKRDRTFRYDAYLDQLRIGTELGG